VALDAALLVGLALADKAKSMLGDDDAVVQALRAGARGYIVKGAQQHEILDAIRSVHAGRAVIGATAARQLATLVTGPAPNDPFPDLTTRERDVLHALTAGASTAQIADRVGLSDTEGPRLVRFDRLAEHEPMAVGRPKRELAHAPPFVSGGLEDLCAGSNGSRVKPVNVVDAEVCDITVIAKLARGGNVRAAAEHEGDVARATEPPIARVNVIELAPEDVAIPRAGPVQVMNRENRRRGRDLHEKHSAAIGP